MVVSHASDSRDGRPLRCGWLEHDRDSRWVPRDRSTFPVGTFMQGALTDRGASMLCPPVRSGHPPDPTVAVDGILV